MRQFKVVLLGACALALAVGTAHAGVNPANPGIVNNLSSSCIQCHTQAPGGGTHAGSHFVFNTAQPAYTTHSGGGGTFRVDGQFRTAGQYFKTTSWAQGGYSKYGRTADNNSYSAANDNSAHGAAVYSAAGTAATYQTAQIICESCHNVIHNVPGGNNLLAPMVSATANGTTQVAPQSAGVPATNGPEAPLCIGCHGFMYTESATAPNPAGTNYADTRNTSDFGGRKGNNNAHAVNGTKVTQNHHVGTGDPIANTLAVQMYLWRDVTSVPSSGVAAAIDTGVTTRGQMPQQNVWTNDGGKIKATTTTWLNCMHCHAEPHSGLNGTAASILRDTNAGGTFTATGIARQDYILRMEDSGRKYMGFSDVNYCNDCHFLKP